MPQCACRFAALLALSACWGAATCRAQEIEPRAYAPSPVGVNLLLGVAAYSEGGVLTDPSLPVTDIEAKISALGSGYVRTFSLAGRSANVGFAVPYVQLDASGNIGEAQRTASRKGVGDTKLRLAVNLLGGPAMTPRATRTQNHPRIRPRGQRAHRRIRSDQAGEHRHQPLGGQD
jgi:hypothetical protein